MSLEAFTGPTLGRENFANLVLLEVVEASHLITFGGDACPARSRDTSWTPRENAHCLSGPRAVTHHRNHSARAERYGSI
jgi:hypothetical protein